MGFWGLFFFFFFLFNMVYFIQEFYTLPESECMITHCASGGPSRLLSLFDPIKIQGDEREQCRGRAGERFSSRRNNAFLSCLDSNA